MFEQLDLFSFDKEELKIKKPVRLIELFAGIGSQAMALRDLGIDFEHYRVVEFDDFMQKLSYENSSSKEIVCYMWKTCKGNGILQQALSEVQEIWQSLYDLGESYYLIRIRKLVPKCCWRLMGFTDEDFHKAEAVNSNTQLYKQAGNSIVKNVLVAIMGQLFEDKEDVYKNI